MDDRFASSEQNDTSDDVRFEAQRASRRDSLLLIGTLYQAGRIDAGRSVRIRNLSSGGLMADRLDTLVPGDAVEIEMKGVGRVSGRIAWLSAGRMGVAFAEPIDPEQARRPVGTKRMDGALLKPEATDLRRPGFRTG